MDSKVEVGMITTLRRAGVKTQPRTPQHHILEPSYLRTMWKCSFLGSDHP